MAVRRTAVAAVDELSSQQHIELGLSPDNRVLQEGELTFGVMACAAFISFALGRRPSPRSDNP